MTLEHTLSIIKPDGVANNHIGNIITALKKQALKLLLLK